MCHDKLSLHYSVCFKMPYNAISRINRFYVQYLAKDLSKIPSQKKNLKWMALIFAEVLKNALRRTTIRGTGKMVMEIKSLNSDIRIYHWSANSALL